ncbi:MAG: MotA/TolQ/ExbB proton channel family protein [Chlamydiae bacterium]|nr:MotA/TolQ/ExbB proton channel family protein [Chlamydiota bacterium]
MILLASSSIIYSAYSQSDFFGKVIFISLFLLSIICWINLIYKTKQTKQVKRLAIAFQQLFHHHKDHLLNLDLESLPKPKKNLNLHPFREIFSAFKQKTMEILQKNHHFASKEEKTQIYLSQNDLELIESHVLTTISSQVKYLEKDLYLLSTIAALAPFVGLLGTTWGILLTFSGFQTGAMTSSNSMVLNGLSTALATTVLGLIIAIPALISYNYLKNSVKYISSDMENFLYRLLSVIELQYRKPF